MRLLSAGRRYSFSLEISSSFRQLGFTYGNKTLQSKYGTVPKVFAMDDVNCNGREEILQNCKYNSADNCGGSEGAGVICYTPGELYVTMNRLAQ